MSATALAQKVKTIFSLPEIVLQVSELLRHPESSLAELEELIIHDPGLTASILKVVNSSFYGFPGKIDTLSKAISIIGFRELNALVISTSVVGQFKNMPPELVDMDTFWYQSVVRGVLAKKLALHCKRDNSERFFVAGLLSCIGKLILFTQYPEQSADILRTGKQNDAEIAAAERGLFGFDYAELSAALLNQWKLPQEIWGSIAYQLKPLDSPIDKTDACILHVASVTSNIIEPWGSYQNGAFNAQTKQAVFNPGVLEYLQLSTVELDLISNDAVLHAMEVTNTLLPHGVSIY